MAKVVSGDDLKASIERTKANWERALALFYKHESNISESVEAVLTLSSLTQKGYLMIMEEQSKLINKLDLLCRQQMHDLHVEKTKNTGTFKNN